MLTVYCGNLRYRETVLLLETGGVRFQKIRAKVFQIAPRENISRAKAQRRKENRQKRGSALRLCAFAGETAYFLCKADTSYISLLTERTIVWWPGYKHVVPPGQRPGQLSMLLPK